MAIQPRDGKVHGKVQQQVILHPDYSGTGGVGLQGLAVELLHVIAAYLQNYFAGRRLGQ